MSENLQTTIEQIKANVKQHSASVKDEVSVMQAMLNDREYEVDVYKRNGETQTFAPGREFRNMLGDILSSAAKINRDEAGELIDKYEIRRGQAQTMVDVSKEYIYSYTKTGRKFKLGGREDANVSLTRREYEPGVRRYPRKVGSADGSMESGEVWVGAYSGIKASSPCPPWIKQNNQTLG